MKPELLDPIEWESITQVIDIEFGKEVTKKLLGNKTPIVIMKESQRNIYLIPLSWMNMLLDESPEDFEYHLIGKQLGVVSKERFRLSLQILQELAGLTNRRLVVSKKAAEAFTYGRSILKESVIRFDENLKRRQRVLVMNEDSECLGIAALSGDKLVGKNLVDIGWFIRRLG